MKDANRIVELLKKIRGDSLIQTQIKNILHNGSAMEAMEMISDLKAQDGLDPEDVQKALGEYYDEIRDCWQ